MLFLCTAAGWAQGLVKGKVLDKRNSEPLSFVNVKVSQTATGKFVSGGMTDAVGNFNIQGLANDRYYVRGLQDRDTQVRDNSLEHQSALQYYIYV